MRALKIILVLTISLVVLYFMGPKPNKPVFDNVLPLVGNNVSNYVDSNEKTHRLKPNNEAKTDEKKLSL